MRINKEIRAEAAERFKPIKKKLMLFTIGYFLLVGLISAIPYVGTIGSVLSPFFAIGLIVSVVNVYNGQGENENPVSFFKHTFEYFVQTLCSYLWVVLHCIVGFIIMIVGIIVLGISGVGTAGLMMSEGYSSIGVKSMGILGIAGFAIYFIGIIVLIIQMLKYQAISYEIIHNPTKKAKDLVNDAGKHINGHKWQWFCMGFYYGLKMFAVYFVIGFVFGIAIIAINNATVGGILSVAMVIAIFLMIIKIFPEMICACESLYQDMMGEAQQSNEQPMNY